MKCSRKISSSELLPLKCEFSPTLAGGQTKDFLCTTTYFNSEITHNSSPVHFVELHTSTNFKVSEKYSN
jgi:hypothetical protein